ncbi:MAG: hypothetical protein ACO1RX_19435 [Candidatus Sericytochromatia bacterium]
MTLTALRAPAILSTPSTSLPSRLAPAVRPAPIPAVATPDRLKLSAAVQAPGQLQHATPVQFAQGRSRAEYEQIFSWVEKVTGKPIAFQDDRSKQAYIQAIQGKSQDSYDTQGFLRGIGVTNAETYGRDDKGVHSLLKTIDYSPNSEEVSLPLRVAQKSFFWFFKTFPKTFNKVADLVDKHYFTRKDTKAESWLKVPVPQPGINPSEAILPAAQVRAPYSANLMLKQIQNGQKATPEQLFNRHFRDNPPAELGAMFEEDFHMGVPKEGETPHNYGTYSVALRLGFSADQARRMGTANFDMDLNSTIYGDTDAFPNAKPSRHFNLNKNTPEKGDTRFIWAQRHLDAAVELAKRGRFEQAEKEIGYGLHSIQDAFAHGHIRLASHAITDNIPDGVDFNPVGAYEATLATIGYLNTYMERLSQLP